MNYRSEVDWPRSSQWPFGTRTGFLIAFLGVVLLLRDSLAVLIWGGFHLEFDVDELSII